MPKYDNYSPQIPNTDFNSDPLITEADPQPEPQPVRRRRVRAAAGEASASRRKQKDDKSKQPESKPTTGEPFFQRLKNALTSTTARITTGIILGGTGFWFAVAFLSYFVSCVTDQSLVVSETVGNAVNVVNDAGEGGARLTELLINQGFGLGFVVVIVWLICMSLKLLIGFPRFRTLDFTIKSLIAMITISVVVGMLTIGLDTKVNWGGFHGRYINEIIYGFVGWSGAIILSIVLLSIFVTICLRDAVKWVLKKKAVFDERRRIKKEEEAAILRKEAEIREMELREKRDEALSGESLDSTRIKDDIRQANESSVDFDPEEDTIFDIPDDPDESEGTSRTDIEKIAGEHDDIEIQEETEIPETPDENPATLAASTDEWEKAHVESAEDADVRNEMPAAEPQDIPLEGAQEDTEGAQEDTADDTPAEENPDVMTVNVNQIEKGSEKQAESYDANLFTHVYNFPPSEFLRPGSEKISVDASEQMENKEKIRKTLLDFGIPITSIEATVGPTVTLYEIRPDTGVKIAKIKNLADDISLSLAAIGVRIIAPIPGKGTVGIEVANKDPQTVSMRTIIQSKVYQERKQRLPIALGSTISNDVYIADLAKMPHLLVAGATGQGKSVGLNAIITSLLYSKRPEELKFVMVDPKRVEFSLYSKIEKYYLAEIPNCEQPIITNMENVVATLSSLCVEMDERYKLLEKAMVRQVHEYNDKFRAKRLDPREGHRFMPYIVVIIDEFADLIMTAGKEVEMPIARLAQLARAVGIHVIIATQRPSTNVITGMIKANFPVRIAFKVSSGVDSKTILDHTGAQQLIGRGDMLISNNGEVTRVQCAFVDTPEVEEVCDYIARQPYPQGAYLLPEPLIGGDADGGDIDQASLGKKDPLLEEVARQIVMSSTASTSAIQRRYEIGYNRAGRIMDQLQALGVVGPATGGKARDVLVDQVTLESILASM